MIDLVELAEAKNIRAVWTCTCGADNPNTYAVCHDCRQPSSICAVCGTVSPRRYNGCTDCGQTIAAEPIEDKEMEFELTFEEWVAMQVGPRKVGGLYVHRHAGSEHEVLAIERPPGPGLSMWRITVRWLEDGRIGSHCTGWDPRRDRVIAEPTRASGEAVAGCWLSTLRPEKAPAPI